jgi:hypothetical protein
MGYRFEGTFHVGSIYKEDNQPLSGFVDAIKCEGIPVAWLKILLPLRSL